MRGSFEMTKVISMEETYNIKAIILNRRPLGEDDSRVVVYSPERGKLELVARGTKKIKSKLAGHLEPFCLTDIMAVRGRQYDYVGAAVSENCYSKIKSDLDKLEATGEAIRIFEKLVKPGVADEAIFNLLEDYLATIETIKAVPDYLTNFFIFKLLAKLGHKPELIFCVDCSGKIQAGGNGFALAKGGLVCAKCLDLKNNFQMKISDDAIKVLRLIEPYRFKQLIKIKISRLLVFELANIINKFFSYNF